MKLKMIVTVVGALILLLTACVPQTGIGGDPAALRNEAARIEEATRNAQQAIANATAASADATRNAQQAQMAALQIEQTQVAMRATDTAVQAQATREAVAVQATTQAVATQQAYANQLLENEIAYEQQRLQQELQQERIGGYLVLALKAIGVLAAVVLVAGLTYRFYASRKRDETMLRIVQDGVRNLQRPGAVDELHRLIEATTPARRPTVATVNGVTMVQDQSSQPLLQRLITPQAAPWVIVRGAATPDAGPVAQLPPPSLQELRPSDAGHVLIQGATRSGKSTAMRHWGKARQNLIVVDPHYGPGSWPTAEMVLTDYTDIMDLFYWMRFQLDERRRLRNDGVNLNNFTPMTVMLDELPNLAAALGNARGKEAYDVWQRWARESWKYNLYAILATHSTLVATLGIQGKSDVLDNFRHRLYLGRAAYQIDRDLASGMKRPALLTVDGDDPQPVVIPYVPTEDPESDQFRPVNFPRARFNQQYLEALVGTAVGQPQHAGEVIPVGDLDGDGREDVVIDAPHFGPQMVGLHTEEAGFIPPRDVQKIVRTYSEGNSLSSTAQIVYGYRAGAAFYKVRQVVEAMDLDVVE